MLTEKHYWHLSSRVYIYEQHLAQELADSTPSHLQSTHNRKMWAYEHVRSGFTFRQYGHIGDMLTNGNKSAARDAAVSEGVADAPEPPLVRGGDLVRMFPAQRPGPWVGKMLRELLEQQYSGEFSDRHQALLTVQHML